MTRSSLPAALVAGGIVGSIAGLLALDPQFIAGHAMWVRPENDYNAYLVAWTYYVKDAWRFPLFSIPLMGYPEGGSVLLNDALPIAALFTKILYRLFGVLINPFGWWIFLTYVMQGAASAHLMRAVGATSVRAYVTAAALAAASTPFVLRMGHTALSTHALVIWAIALHFSSLRQSRLGMPQWTFLLAVTLLTNAYLFAMVFALAATTLAALLVRREAGTRDLKMAAFSLVILLAIGLTAGYGFVFTNPRAMGGIGFGKFSWNLVSLLLPPEGFFGALKGIPRDATHGQYEGESYIGPGALLMLVVALAWRPRDALAAVRKYWVFCAALVLLAAFAASHRIYAGNVQVISYELPSLALSIGSAFRASGRFVWPLAYSLMLLPAAWVFRRWHAVPATLVACLALYLQIADAEGGFRYRRTLTTEVHRDLIDAPRVTPWLAEHQRVWQFPSWDCGGLAGPGRVWPSDDTNRELQLQLAAARAGLPINSIYSSRPRKNCAREARWAATPRLDDGVLYVIAPRAVGDLPQLSAIASSSSCVALEWAVVCSTAFVHR